MKILVTGAASGLGLAIAEKLLQQHELIITYCRSEKSAKALCARQPRCQAVRCDFTSADEVSSLLRQIPAMKPEALVNNALAQLEIEHFQKISPDSFLNGFRANVIPTLVLTQACLQVFRNQRMGKIITILSSHLLGRPPVGLSEYLAEKAYLLSMSKSWAAENAKFNITSNCISPSMMRTGLTSGADERVLQLSEQSHPQGRLIEPGEVAEAVASLLGMASQVNSINLPVNGGMDVG